MSHEGTGIVAATGSAVTTFEPGDRVLSGTLQKPCGQCENCNVPASHDWKQYCIAAGGALGLFSDGAFAQYHVADSRMSCRVPDSVSLLTAAPLACAGVSVYRAVSIAGVKPGGSLAIVGAGGGLGHFGVQFAKLHGLVVVAIDARDDGLELARRLGADHVLDARAGKEQVVAQVRALTEGKGVDAVVNVSDHLSTTALSAAIARQHGTVILVAQPEQVILPFQDIVLRDVTIKGSVMGGPAISQEMLDTVATHKVRAEVHVFEGLDEVSRMLELARAGTLGKKAVCVVDKDLASQECSLPTGEEDLLDF
jgi:propanol-preferring alcohol dehydrogenase